MDSNAKNKQFENHIALLEAKYFMYMSGSFETPTFVPTFFESLKSRDPTATIKEGMMRGKIIHFNILKKISPGNLTYIFL